MAMNMLGAGFATMFLSERLVFGMAPDDLESALTQRLRWAMALQVRRSKLSYIAFAV
jgi:cellulose synthase/poly-beta-1,6-N-acetylglucosamine synthase-like glycosyltransferase